MISQEKKNDRLGMGISLGIHAALLILFFFLLAWKEPFPPLPEYGIEVNFGLENAGSGDNQPQTPANNNPTPVEDPAPEEPAPTQEEVPTETVTETIQEEAAPSPTETPEITEPVEQTQVTQPEPNLVPEQESPEEQKIEKEPEPKQEPKLDPAASYPNKKSTTSGANGTTGAADEPANSNQGDKPGETGDQGNPEGKLDSRALYGNPGGGAGGAALDMTGWNWDFLPRPEDTSNETGHIVFEIKIDEDGEILSIRTIEKSVSEPLVKIYRSEVTKLTFSPTSTNSRPAPTSTGRITFIIKSQ
jgi:outer membrane biosynthesis protein TonB